MALSLHKLSRAVVTSGVTLALIAAPVGATDVVFEGNGAFSDNSAAVVSESSQTVVQTNVANVVNSVSSISSTGGNDASFNTGGDSVVMSGNAGTAVQLGTQVNSNAATIAGGHAAADGTVAVLGNGAGSVNWVDVASGHHQSLFQDNVAYVTNDVAVESLTGDNSAGYNTGGDSVVQTGAALTEVGIMTEANRNVAQVGGMGASAALHAGGDIVFEGNGAYSWNGASVAHESSESVVQSNQAWISNYVDVFSDTGYNDTSFNTGGDSLVRTGAADTAVGIQNRANSNALAMGGHSMEGSMDVIFSGNGAYAVSDFLGEHSNESEFFQDNVATTVNEVSTGALSGDNSAGYNTSSVNGNHESVVMSGRTISETAVGTQANTNVLSLGGMNVSFGWNFGSLGNVLGGFFR